MSSKITPQQMATLPDRASIYYWSRYQPLPRVDFATLHRFRSGLGYNCVNAIGHPINPYALGGIVYTDKQEAIRDCRDHWQEQLQRMQSALSNLG